jgi:hypothetical protein
VDAAADPDVLKLPRLNKVANLALGEADAGGKLLRSFEAVSHGDLLCCTSGARF